MSALLLFFFKCFFWGLGVWGLPHCCPFGAPKYLGCDKGIFTCICSSCGESGGFHLQKKCYWTEPIFSKKKKFVTLPSPSASVHWGKWLLKKICNEIFFEQSMYMYCYIINWVGKQRMSPRRARGRDHNHYGAVGLFPTLLSLLVHKRLSSLFLLFCLFLNLALVSGLMDRSKRRV